ncbi:MAG TPA: helix-turn-helix domain-containing protein [Candidatus Didemnitutus sp.]|nr:helix-turn-helix domain-containing protein [Candidatus Didemnitutus sp.]
MNPTSRAIFQSVISSDATLTGSERAALERLVRGESSAPAATTGGVDEQLLLSQKKAAKLLDVSRVTVWRMTKECVLHPVEILPGTWRYPYREIVGLAQSGEPLLSPGVGSHQTAAA